MRVEIEQLDSGFVVTVDDLDAPSVHRSAEATLQGALTIAARTFGHRGTIEFPAPILGRPAPNVGIPFDPAELGRGEKF